MAAGVTSAAVAGWSLTGVRPVVAIAIVTVAM
jgi:hypothetical protein